MTLWSRSPEVATRVRTLDDADLADVMELLSTDPVGNVFLLSRFGQFGLERHRLGCYVFGAWSGERLVGVLHAGANLVPVCTEPGVLGRLAAHVGPWRHAASIMGRADLVIALHTELARRWGRPWAQAREIRAHQPLMVMGPHPVVAADPRVTLVTGRHFNSYFEAAVAMYTEEVGVTPLDSSNGYRRHMSALVDLHNCFGIVDDGVVRFKSDIGVAWRDVCQIQGVWMDPAWRHHGSAAAAMAGVVELCRRRYPTVSLYVNDFNTPALKMYRRVGFTQVGEMATVLY